MSNGIDYGMGTTNIDRATGIRFGVIPMNALTHWAWESFEADYGSPSCGKCGNEAVPVNDESVPELDGTDEEWERDGCEDYACVACCRTFDSSDAYGEEAVGHDCTDPDYTAHVGSDCVDAFITSSPYYTHARFCSPCAPGACYLLSPTDKTGPKAYCFGHDWFESGKAPYPVWEVKTGKLVRPAPKK